MGVGMMRRPWSQPVKLNKNTGHGLWMCWLEQAQQYACFLHSGQLWHLPQNSINQDGIYLQLSLKGSDSSLIKSCRHQFNYCLELDSNPLPQPILLWLSFFQPKSHHFYYNSFLGSWGHVWTVFCKLRASTSCLIQAYSEAVRVHFENSDLIFFLLKTNPLFVFRGNLSRIGTCCDTEFSNGQVHRKTVAV